jgi:hypothetical protein
MGGNYSGRHILAQAVVTDRESNGLRDIGMAHEHVVDFAWSHFLAAPVYELAYPAR